MGRNSNTDCLYHCGFLGFPSRLDRGSLGCELSTPSPCPSPPPPPSPAPTPTAPNSLHRLCLVRLFLVFSSSVALPPGPRPRPPRHFSYPTGDFIYSTTRTSLESIGAWILRTVIEFYPKRNGLSTRKGYPCITLFAEVYRTYRAIDFLRQSRHFAL